MKASQILALGATFATLACATPAAPPKPEPPADVGAWLSVELPRAEKYLAANISPNLPGYQKGFVVAAPWAVEGVQNYRYHWVRDAALVMNTIVTRYTDADDRAPFLAQLRAYAHFSKANQTAPEPPHAEKVGLGEVKFNPDGTRFTAWMRPQNDGPALRAITFIRFARALLREGKPGLAQHLFSGRGGRGGLAAPGIIAADLEYLLKHARDVSYDPWEEVKGHHFYTALVQRKALLAGAQLADLLGAPDKARRYRAEAHDLEATLVAHWIPAGQKTPTGSVSDGQIWATFDRVAGLDDKTSGLDVTVVLGALHAHDEFDDPEDHLFSPSDPRVLATAYALSEAFESVYPLARTTLDSVPIGRYPEDKYNGYDSKHAGNPWILTTAAYAELYYRCAQEWVAAGKIEVSAVDLKFLNRLVTTPLREGATLVASDPQFNDLVSTLRQLGDLYLRQVMSRMEPNGHFTEEFSRDDGSPQGAQDLSWSYASVITAAAHR